MTTSFSSLPIVDLSVLSRSTASQEELSSLSKKLYNVFATTGFAYLVNAPLSFNHDAVFDLARNLFSMQEADKLALAKKMFVSSNRNTYRGYFPPQPGQMDNLKEGFEVGPANAPKQATFGRQEKFNLAESNVWPAETSMPGGRPSMERLHSELQGLSAALLSLLATSLGKPADYFASYLVGSLSTLRLLHYPPQHRSANASSNEVRLCCTPHTDSGILTLLHQDPTGGLEVQNAQGEWVAAPYVPGSIVVNIGDLMAEVSGGRFVATKHRVRTNGGGSGRSDGMGRFSVPFFFEPGEACVVRSVDGGDGVMYGQHVRQKMGTWVEFQDLPATKTIDDHLRSGIAVRAC